MYINAAGNSRTSQYLPPTDYNPGTTMPPYAATAETPGMVTNIADAISQLDTSSSTSTMYTVAHVCVFYVLYTCVAFMITWTTRNNLPATIDTLLSVQTHMANRQNIPQDAYHGLFARYMEYEPIPWVETPS